MTLEQKLDNNITISIVKEICKRSFYQFFKLAWDSVESADYEDNWHIKYLCDELQKRFNIWEKKFKYSCRNSTRVGHHSPGTVETMF